MQGVLNSEKQFRKGSLKSGGTQAAIRTAAFFERSIRKVVRIEHSAKSCI